MAGSERISRHRANLFRAILAHVSDPNKLLIGQSCNAPPSGDPQSSTTLPIEAYSDESGMNLMSIAQELVKTPLIEVAVTYG